MSSKTKHPCPTCKKESAWKNNPHRPFCSKRCQLIDLGSWLKGEFAIPGEKVTLEDQPEEMGQKDET